MNHETCRGSFPVILISVSCKIYAHLGNFSGVFSILNVFLAPDIDSARICQQSAEPLREVHLWHRQAASNHSITDPAQCAGCLAGLPIIISYLNWSLRTSIQSTVYSKKSSQQYTVDHPQSTKEDYSLDGIGLETTGWVRLARIPLPDVNQDLV